MALMLGPKETLNVVMEWLMAFGGIAALGKFCSVSDCDMF